MSSEDEEEAGLVDSDNVEVGAEVEADTEAAASPREETPEARSMEARRKLREQMEAEIAAFLKAGGRIEHVEPVAAVNTAPTATAGSEEVDSEAG